MPEKQLGDLVSYTPAAYPRALTLDGNHVRLEPLTAQHAPMLQQAFASSTDNAIWDYLPYGPFPDAKAYAAWIDQNTSAGDPHFFAIYLKGREIYAGVCSYLRINPKDGSIEVGHINYSPLMQGGVAATEVMYLMMRWAFEAGYRRYEWKCNALNAKSRSAAQRLGFSFEGVFRQATISKGRNRDTAWFAMIDREWPQLDQAFTTWLDPINFDDNGQQGQRLSDLTAPIRVASDPSL